MRKAFSPYRTTLAVLALSWLGCTLSGQELPNLPALTPAELSMTDNPKEPGGPAAILYYAVITDNHNSTETHSMRIKVFRDDGKKYADVEIPYLERYSQVEDIQARTIGSDGKITPLNQEIFDREIVRLRKFGYRAKVFTLPDVRVGSVLEYSYRLHYKEKIPDAFQHPNRYVFDRGMTYTAAEWNIQRDLYLMHGHFTLLPVNGALVEHYTVGLPKSTFPEMATGLTEFDFKDMPAFSPEEYSLPEDELKAKMTLYYEAGFGWPDAYWSGLGREWAKLYDKFIGLKRSKAIDAEVARLTSSGDSDEAKLRKLYNRVQQIRDLGYEEPKTEKEFKREKLPENKVAQDVLEHGYGSGHELNLLFIAMARSAGFTADPVAVVSRKNGLFKKDYPNHEQLDAVLVRVRTGAQVYFLDPETRFCPFGMLPWYETAAGGVILNEMNPQIGTTPEPVSADAATRYSGRFQLDAEGNLKGELQIRYERQEALIRRLWNIRADVGKRSKEMEEALKSTFPDGTTIKFKSAEGWDTPENPLTVQYEIEIPNYATPAGRRLVLPLGVLHLTEKNPFPSPRRVYPIYFEYPYEVYEDMHIELPPGMRAEGLPKEKKADRGAVKYDFEVQQDGTGLQIKRTRLVHGCYIPLEQYANLRSYFDEVLAGDTQQVTLQGTQAAEAKPAP